MADRVLSAQSEAWSVRVNARVCVLCGACAQVCPTDALVLEDGDRLRLHLDPIACIHCEACVNACAVEALDFDWGPAGAQIVAESDWVQCQGCGEMMATQAELEAISARLQAAGFSPALLDLAMNYCPACKYANVGMPKGH